MPDLSTVSQRLSAITWEFGGHVCFNVPYTNSYNLYSYPFTDGWLGSRRRHDLTEITDNNVSRAGRNEVETRQRIKLPKGFLLDISRYIVHCSTTSLYIG